MQYNTDNIALNVSNVLSKRSRMRGEKKMVFEQLLRENGFVPEKEYLDYGKGEYTKKDIRELAHQTLLFYTVISGRWWYKSSPLGELALMKEDSDSEHLRNAENTTGTASTDNVERRK